MRTVLIGGVPATIFDEKTHPLGLEYQKTHVVVGDVKVEAVPTVEAKVSVSQKVADVIKKKK